MSSERNFEKETEAFENTKEVWKKDVPACSEAIEASYDCHLRKRALRLSNRSLMCSKETIELSWCLVGSFCPAEFEELKECLGGAPTFRPDEVTGSLPPVPLRCALSWNQFDRCLTKQTKEYEREYSRT
eukprot:TRINITY_DN7187_c0_g1_i1.p1 TRINITY_DN7187_c0_g1~~TRINITY_DN7187_c0_g1_i1.p1  ORF type:complete len:129 (-),score=16.00 TRINITY_DN7187_c0_g1_i1:130-516(-)